MGQTTSMCLLSRQCIRLDQTSKWVCASLQQSEQRKGEDRRLNLASDGRSHPLVTKSGPARMGEL